MGNTQFLSSSFLTVKEAPGHGYDLWLLSVTKCFSSNNTLQSLTNERSSVTWGWEFRLCICMLVAETRRDGTSVFGSIGATKTNPLLSFWIWLTKCLAQKLLALCLEQTHTGHLRVDLWHICMRHFCSVLNYIACDRHQGDIRGFLSEVLGFCYSFMTSGNN